MRSTVLSRVLRFAGVLALGLSVIAVRTSAQDHKHDAAQKADQKHEAGAHTHAAAAKLANPVKVTPQSIAAGQKLFQGQCVNCHGPAGLGDGKEAPKLNPKPSNLTDGSWKHGATDGEMFTVIRDGAKANGKPAMPSFASKMTAQDIWNTVNYIRSLTKK
jgi:putative ABC transport system permease protein